MRLTTECTNKVAKAMGFPTELLEKIVMKTDSVEERNKLIMALCIEIFMRAYITKHGADGDEDNYFYYEKFSDYMNKKDVSMELTDD